MQPTKGYAKLFHKSFLAHLDQQHLGRSGPDIFTDVRLGWYPHHVSGAEAPFRHGAVGEGKPSSKR
jgi:hypothetical protein